MQKLITIYLNNQVYEKGKLFARGADEHGVVEEHLQDFLQQGWTVKAIQGFGGGSESFYARGWVVALLEK